MKCSLIKLELKNKMNFQGDIYEKLQENLVCFIEFCLNETIIIPGCQ